MGGMDSCDREFFDEEALPGLTDPEKFSPAMQGVAMRLRELDQRVAALGRWSHDRNFGGDLDAWRAVQRRRVAEARKGGRVPAELSNPPLIARGVVNRVDNVI